MSIDYTTVIQKFDNILSRGLSVGLGSRDGQMCIEAAICAAMGEPHGDNPSCVAQSVRAFEIQLNDSKKWKSPESRAKGLRDLGIAQLGSKEVVDDKEFTRLLAGKVIQRLVPKLFRQLFPGNPELLECARQCEIKGTKETARNAATAATAACAVYAATAAAAVAVAVYADAADAADAAAAVAVAADAAASYTGEVYLLLVAELALETLKELKSPGCQYI